MQYFLVILTKCILFPFLSLFEILGRGFGILFGKRTTPCPLSNAPNRIQKTNIKCNFNGTRYDQSEISSFLAQVDFKKCDTIISVVLIEDEKHIRMLFDEEIEAFITQTFPETIYIITVFENCFDINELYLFNPDVLVIDIKLAENQSGLNILQEVRGKDQSTPVILYTAYDSFSNDLKAIAADYYIVKSVDLKELKDTLSTIFLKIGKAQFSKTVYSNVFLERLKSDLNEKRLPNSSGYTFYDFNENYNFSEGDEKYQYILSLFNKISILFDHEFYDCTTTIARYLNKNDGFVDEDIFANKYRILSLKRIKNEIETATISFFAEKAKEILRTETSNYCQLIDKQSVGISKVRLVLDILNKSQNQFATQDKLLRHLLADTRHDLINAIRKLKFEIKNNIHPTSNSMNTLFLNLENTVERLKSIYAYTITPNFIRIELRKLVENAIHSMVLPGTIAVTLSRKYTNSCLVDVDVNFFFISLKHIITNSIDARGDGLVIDIYLDCNENSAFVFIADNGPGIPKKFFNCVFDQGTTTKDGHAGDGLSLALAMIQTLGGSISFNSERDIGAEAVIQLPKSVF